MKIPPIRITKPERERIAALTSNGKLVAALMRFHPPKDTILKCLAVERDRRCKPVRWDVVRPLVCALLRRERAELEEEFTKPQP